MGMQYSLTPWGDFMMGTSGRWQRHLFLLVLSGLVACSAAENAEQLIALAEQAKQEERLHAAADLYHRAARLRPDDFNVQYETGLLYLQVANLSEAEEHLRRAIELRPEVAPARLNLGVVLLQAGDREASRQAFLEALRIGRRQGFESKTHGSLHAWDLRFLAGW